MKKNSKKPISISLSILFIFILQNISAQDIPLISYPLDGRPDEAEIISGNSRNDDFSINTAFYAIAPNALWPYSQVECFYTGADINYSGNSVGYNTLTEISITDEANGTNVFSDTLFYGTFPPGTNVEQIIIPNCFTPDGSITNYTGRYTISSDIVDVNPDNNYVDFEFETTSYTFSKETGYNQIIAPDESNWAGGGGYSWAFGNYYYIVDGSYPVSEAIFSLGNAEDPDLMYQIITIALYKWEEDLNSNSEMDIDERELVATNFYEIQGTETPDQLINIPLLNYSNFDEPVMLEDETGYVLMIEYYTQDEINLFLSASDEYNYAAQRFVSMEKGVPRYGSLIGIGVDALENTSYISIGYTNVVPVARLVLGEPIINNIQDITSDQKSLIISPNPASNNIRIQYPDMRLMDEASIAIYDTKGQLIMTKVLNQLSGSQIDIDVSHFTNGVYFTHLKTGEAAIKGSFVVHH